MNGDSTAVLPMQASMSELLPPCPSMPPSTADQLRNAALTVCEVAGYDRAIAIDYLRCLGLIIATPDGYVAAGDDIWSIHPLNPPLA